ncbi:hypothetical protein GIB67_008566 [Kingdonia uniflora]|uniref:Uncharacterized protein n=1 Tax=Kingdonia uniflora TaxID=39325 RepID=A0A7J7N3T3_9MAGN|nr:hypothetical protein GIB67_008566 [Kingdonia uniflora]
MAMEVSSMVAAADTRGKHRIVAELKRLEQEARSLELTLEESRGVEFEKLKEALPLEMFQGGDIGVWDLCCCCVRSLFGRGVAADLWLNCEVYFILVKYSCEIWFEFAIWSKYEEKVDPLCFLQSADLFEQKVKLGM